MSRFTSYRHCYYYQHHAYATLVARATSAATTTALPLSKRRREMSGTCLLLPLVIKDHHIFTSDRAFKSLYPMLSLLFETTPCRSESNGPNYNGTRHCHLVGGYQRRDATGGSLHALMAARKQRTSCVPRRRQFPVSIPWCTLITNNEGATVMDANWSRICVDTTTSMLDCYWKNHNGHNDNGGVDGEGT
jgi:hypothetical protein